MGRTPKYPDAQATIDAFYQAVSESYRSPAKDEIGDIPGRKKQEILAEEFGISRLKVRKILITTGDISYPETVRIQNLMKAGKGIDEISRLLNLKKSTINAYLPYGKGVYKLEAVSAVADRVAMYRARKAAVATLQKNMDTVSLWKAVCLFAGYPFQTSGRGSKPGVKFTYTVSDPGGAGGRGYQGESIEGFGNEIFINGREKSISRSSVDYAFSIVQQMDGVITGPKQLKIYGGSYVYAMFVRFGIV